MSNLQEIWLCKGSLRLRLVDAGYSRYLDFNYRGKKMHSTPSLAFKLIIVCYDLSGQASIIYLVAYQYYFIYPNVTEHQQDTKGRFNCFNRTKTQPIIKLMIIYLQLINS